MHLSLLEQCDISIDSLGEVVLQDAFLAWDNKQIIRKGRERRVFLFELYLLFAKEVKDSSGIVKYHFKHKVMTSELGVTEHIEGDECKFAVWTGRAPMLSDYRMVLKANTLETKQIWVKKLREVIQETYFSGASLTLPKSPAKSSNSSKTAASSQRSSKDMDDTLCENDHDGSSLASYGSGNTTDSDKVSSKRHLVARCSCESRCSEYCYSCVFPQNKWHGIVMPNGISKNTFSSQIWWFGAQSHRPSLISVTFGDDNV